MSLLKMTKKLQYQNTKFEVILIPNLMLLLGMPLENKVKTVIYQYIRFQLFFIHPVSDKDIQKPKQNVSFFL